MIVNEIFSTVTILSQSCSCQKFGVHLSLTLFGYRALYLSWHYIHIILTTGGRIGCPLNLIWDVKPDFEPTTLLMTDEGSVKAVLSKTDVWDSTYAIISSSMIMDRFCKDILKWLMKFLSCCLLDLVQVTRHSSGQSEWIAVLGHYIHCINYFRLWPACRIIIITLSNVFIN